MQISALGHSCVLLDFDHAESEGSTRILVDPWLSDHATGDAMGRFPRLRFDTRALGPIDAVYLSHAHCDHLDPYTLVRLYKELESPPTLWIPISLSFLIPVFRAHLDDPDIRVLEPHTPTAFRGVQLLGFFDVGPEATNEDDVMVLVVTNGSERVLVEADARLSLELPQFREYINVLMAAPSLDSAVFLTTENELTGTLESRNCQTLDDRAGLAEYAMDEMLESVEQLYSPAEDDDFPGAAQDLWRNPNLLRLVHGQGLTAPHELDARWQRVLFPVRIADRVAAEREASERAGWAHQIDALTVGSVHTIVGGRLVATEPIPGLELLDGEATRTYDPDLSFFVDLPWAPLRSDERDVDDQRARLLDLLNQRFLPHLHGSRQPPLLHLLSSYGGSYRIRLFYGHAPDSPVWDYVLGFESWGFVEVEPGDADPNEAYWANDLDDVLAGSCDEFSVFGRTQLAGLEMRLWACLAAPLLNSDLVRKRVSLHFERAKDGLTPGSFVMPLYDV